MLSSCSLKSRWPKSSCESLLINSSSSRLLMLRWSSSDAWVECETVAISRSELRKARPGCGFRVFCSCIRLSHMSQEHAEPYFLPMYFTNLGRRARSSQMACSRMICCAPYRIDIQNGLLSDTIPHSPATSKYRMGISKTGRLTTNHKRQPFNVTRVFSFVFQ